MVDSAERTELLVVGTRGRGGFLGLRLGSVSVKVAGRAPCPVVVVRPTVDGPGVNTEPRIVVGVDGSDSARNALRWALTEASVRNLPVVVVNGWMEPTVVATFPGMASPIDAISKAASNLIEAELEMAAQDAAGVTVRVQAVSASGASALVDESRGASLVVVGSKGQGGLSRVLLGSVAQQVMCHAECPVVVIPEN
ncbi:MAG: universal stress protein [Candidatus Microthrix sp.]|nr:universal stress protein [Candidatus Microthrix sp.]